MEKRYELYRDREASARAYSAESRRGQLHPLFVHAEKRRNDSVREKVGRGCCLAVQ